MPISNNPLALRGLVLVFISGSGAEAGRHQGIRTVQHEAKKQGFESFP